MSRSIEHQALINVASLLWQRQQPDLEAVLGAWTAARFPKEVPTLFSIEDAASLVSFLGVLEPLVTAEFIPSLSPMLGTRLERLNGACEQQCADGNWDHSPYMCGLANGLKYACGIMADTEPEFLAAPPEWTGEVACG